MSITRRQWLWHTSWERPGFIVEIILKTQIFIEDQDECFSWNSDSHAGEATV